MAQGQRLDQADRLKAALKENLKRRKAQARDRREGGTGPSGGAASTEPATDKRDSSE